MFKFFPIPYSRCNCKCKALAFSLCNLVTFMPNYDGNVLKYKNDNLLSEIFLSNLALSPQLNPKWILDLVACHKALRSVFLLIHLKINDALILGKAFNSLKGPSINDVGNFSGFLTHLHCVLKWVLRGHFLGIKMPQWNQNLSSFPSNLSSFSIPLPTPSWFVPYKQFY